MTTEPQGNGHGESAAGILDKLNFAEAEEVIEETRAAVDQALEVASGFIRERPILCLAGALALGYVVGKLVSR
jgi:hypothetical protein